MTWQRVVHGLVLAAWAGALPAWGQGVLSVAVGEVVSGSEANSTSVRRRMIDRVRSSSHGKELRRIYEEVVEIDTSPARGTGRAARAMAKHLQVAGVAADDLHLVGPKESRLNLVARLRGSGRQMPLLLLAHLDVVEARREDWSMDPFTLHEVGGYFYGRGSLDDKAMVAIFTQIFLDLRRAREKPDRDIILALTADEEGGPNNGVEWLLRERPDLVKAGLVINEGGGGRMKNGRYMQNGVQASEKSYMTFRLEVRNDGGHSSLPTPDNAIYRLAAALQRLQRQELPIEINEVTRVFFERSAALEAEEQSRDIRGVLADPPDPDAALRLSRSPSYNAMLRTTCVATRLQAGHADNALPQLASATVNCRAMPGHSIDEIHQALVDAVRDDQVTITATEKDTAAPLLPIDHVLLQAVEEITDDMWPGVPVIPMMSSGATDSRYFRRAGIPAYGVSGIFVEMDDMRAHGKDERVGIEQFYEGYEFLRRLVRKLAL